MSCQMRVDGGVRMRHGMVVVTVQRDGQGYEHGSRSPGDDGHNVLTKRPRTLFASQIFTTNAADFILSIFLPATSATPSPD